MKASLVREETNEKENFLDAMQLDKRIVSMLSQTPLSQISIDIQIFIPLKAYFF